MYTQWRNFEAIIEKAKEACKSATGDVPANFADVSKIVKTGVAEKERDRRSPDILCHSDQVCRDSADALATCIFDAAKKYLPDMQMRTDNSDGDPDIEEGFYVLRHTLCPCVLTENGFMTNKQECHWLQTRAAKQAIVDLHVEGITEYLSR